MKKWIKNSLIGIALASGIGATAGAIFLVGENPNYTVKKHALSDSSRLNALYSGISASKQKTTYLKPYQYEFVYDLLLEKSINSWFSSEFNFNSPMTDQSVEMMLRNPKDSLWNSLYLYALSSTPNINIYNKESLGKFIRNFDISNRVPRSWLGLKLNLDSFIDQPMFPTKAGFVKMMTESITALSWNKATINVFDGFNLFGGNYQPPEDLMAPEQWTLLSHYFVPVNVISNQASESQLYNLFSMYGQAFIDQFLGNYFLYQNNKGWEITENFKPINGWKTLNAQGKIVHVPTTLNIPISDIVPDKHSNEFWLDVYNCFMKYIVEKLSVKYGSSLLGIILNKSVISKFGNSSLESYFFTPSIFGINLSRFTLDDFLSSLKFSNVTSNAFDVSFYYNPANKSNSADGSKHLTFRYVYVPISNSKGNSSSPTGNFRKWDKQIELLLNQISKEESSVANLGNKIKSQSVLIENLYKEQEHISSEISKLGDLLSAAEKMSQQRSEMESKIQSEIKEINLLNSRLKSRLEIAKQSEVADEEIISSFKEDIAIIKLKIESDNAQDKEMSGQIKSINSENSKIESEILEDESVIKNQDSTINSLETQQANSEETITEDNSKISHLENEISSPGLSSGDYVGIGIGIGMSLVLVIGLSIWYKLKKSKSKNKTN